MENPPAPANATPSTPPPTPSELDTLLNQRRKEEGIDAQAAGRSLKKVTDRLLSRPSPPPPTAADQERELQAKRRENVATFLGGVGRRYRDATLKMFQCRHPGQAEVVEQLRRYAENMPNEVGAGNGVLLYGPSGTGKDFLLVSLARVAIGKHDLTAKHVNGMDLFGTIRDRIDDDQPEAALVSQLAEPKVLLLSDPIPPRGVLTDFQAGFLFRVLDRRYCSCRPTWVSLNVKGASEADERLGAQLVDRLRDGATVCHCDWPSFRERKPAGKDR